MPNARKRRKVSRQQEQVAVVEVSADSYYHANEMRLLDMQRQLYEMQSELWDVREEQHRLREELERQVAQTKAQVRSAQKKEIETHEIDGNICRAHMRITYLERETDDLKSFRDDVFPSNEPLRGDRARCYRDIRHKMNFQKLKNINENFEDAQKRIRNIQRKLSVLKSSYPTLQSCPINN